MKVQFNTDKTISGDARHHDFFISLIEDELERYQSHITRIEVHMSDETGIKEGRNDIQCLLEARIEGKQPITVSEKADTIELAIAGSIDKLKSILDKMLDKLQDHHR